MLDRLFLEGRHFLTSSRFILGSYIFSLFSLQSQPKKIVCDDFLSWNPVARWSPGSYIQNGKQEILPQLKFTWLYHRCARERIFAFVRSHCTRPQHQRQNKRLHHSACKRDCCDIDVHDIHTPILIVADLLEQFYPPWLVCNRLTFLERIAFTSTSRQLSPLEGRS